MSIIKVFFSVYRSENRRHTCSCNLWARKMCCNVWQVAKLWFLESRS